MPVPSLTITLLPYTTLFRSERAAALERGMKTADRLLVLRPRRAEPEGPADDDRSVPRSEEHTSELQSRGHLVCRLLLENKNLRPPLNGARHSGAQSRRDRAP